MDDPRVHGLPSIGDSLYQKKVVQAILQDHLFADQISDVLKPEFLTERYLKEIVDVVFWFKNKYDSFPSFDVLVDIVNTKKKMEIGDIVTGQINDFLCGIRERPLNGDMGYVQDKAIDFCRRQSLLDGINSALSEIEVGDFDSVYKTITDAANKGSARDVGHEYLKGFEIRAEKAIRNPIPTPWPVLNDLFGGGPDRASLITFIAPTGGGKTHFLCNISAAALVAGYNVVYITLEIAEFKIGLRHDSYFSGVAINNVPEDMERVKQEVLATNPKGRLFIKEYPTKGATVQTIRSYLQRLSITQSFKPDIIIVDYAALLNVPRVGDKAMHDLESVYGELRGLSSEYQALVYTADQTNRSGLDQEIVTLNQIADMYNRAAVCDAIITVSRTLEDKENGTGRTFIAKSRFGGDGAVLPFKIDPYRVKVDILDERKTVSQAFVDDEENKRDRLARRFKELTKTNFPVDGE